MPPDDVQEHGTILKERMQAARRAVAKDIGGYDNRRLIKIALTQKISPEDIARAASGIEIVSQEEGTLVLAFASEAQLEVFEAKLASLASGGDVTYRNFLYALRDFDRWTPEDRTGWALGRYGLPVDTSFLIDAELWPLSRSPRANRLRDAFETWVRDNGGEIVDAVRNPYLTVYRLRAEQGFVEDLLRHRDVRTVDLPPRVSLESAVILSSVRELAETPAPPPDAPGIVVLDSGVAAGHPVLAPAMGDAQSFISDAPAADEHGHGTLVAGIALYDDVADCLDRGRFVADLRLFSGRVFDRDNRADPTLIENQVEKAARYFVREYGCRIFNLSYGDENKPYQGRHVAGLAVTLDALSRELDVLFVVPTGNFEGDDDGPADWLSEYPTYLTGSSAKLLDPAPALNALTVGSLARHDAGYPNLRWPEDPAYRPIAGPGQPSPFTRHGPSVGGAIKPDLVDYGGNWLVDSRTRNQLMAGQQGVGEISTSRGFATGRPFAEDAGTSFATPRVAHAATQILREIPNAGPDLCRALLVSHASTPQACSQLFPNNDVALRQVTGYGQMDRSALYRSLEDCATLWAVDSIENRRHHFYEIPIPAAFWQGAQRQRTLTVTLAYRPPVRTTRIDYRAVGVSFKLIPADSLDEVVGWFDAAMDKDEALKIEERKTGRDVSEMARSKGTVQASTWKFVRPTKEIREKAWFVVVTRNDPPWGEGLSSTREHYALAVNLADRLAEQPRLYTSIQIRLRERLRARAQR